MNLEHGSIAHAGVSHHSLSIAPLEFQKGYFRAMLSLFCGRKCLAQTLAALRKEYSSSSLYIFGAFFCIVCFILQPHLSSTPHVFDWWLQNRPEAENLCSAHTILCLDHAVSFRQNCTFFAVVFVSSKFRTMAGSLSIGIHLFEAKIL